MLDALAGFGAGSVLIASALYAFESSSHESGKGLTEGARDAGETASAGVRTFGFALGLIRIVLLTIFVFALAFWLVGLAFVTYDDVLFERADEGFANFWPVFYRSTVLAAFDPIKDILNTILPLTNAVNGSWKILRRNAVLLAADCEEFHFSEVAIGLRDATAAVINGLVRWVLSIFREDFDFFTIFRGIQRATGAIWPVFACWCQSSEILVEVVSDVTTSTHLAASADRAMNLPIAVVRDVLGTAFSLFAAFGQAIRSDETFFDALGDYYWEPDRLPSVERSLRVLGQFVARTADWIDDIVVSVGNRLMNVQTMPRFVAVIGQYGESLILDFNLISDSWGINFAGPLGLEKAIRRLSLLGTRYSGTETSGLWSKTRPVAIRSHGLLVEAAEKAYNASALLEAGFVDIAAPIGEFNFSTAEDSKLLIELSGCILAETSDVLSATLESIVHMWIALFHERIIGGEYGEYFRDDEALRTSIDVAINSSVRFSECSGAFASVLNDPLGRLVNETGHAIEAIVEPFRELKENWDDRLTFLTSVAYRDLVDRAFFELDGIAVAAGNFLRQFAFSGTIVSGTVSTVVADPDVECRLRDPHSEQSPTEFELEDWEAFYPWYVDPWCCIGGAVEEGLRLIFGLFEGITRGIVAFTTSSSGKDGFVLAFGPGGPLDLKAELLPMLDFFLRDVFARICIRVSFARWILETFFGEALPNCGGTGSSFYELLVELWTDTVRLPIRFVLGAVAEFWSWIVQAIAEVPCDEDCWCDRLGALYATTFGQTVQWLAGVVRIGPCALGIWSGIQDLMDSFEAVFGPNGSFRDFVCILVDFIGTMIDLFGCWGNGGGFFECLSDTIFASLSAIIEGIVDCLRDILLEVWQMFVCTFRSLGNWWRDLFSDFGCFFSASNPCPNLVTYLTDCIFTIPVSCGDLGDDIVPGTLPAFLGGRAFEIFEATRINCEAFGVGSQEYLDCLGNTNSSTFTETYTDSIFATAHSMIKFSTKIANGVSGFGSPLSAGDHLGRGGGSIGDVNSDGTPDVVLGAPDEGNGTVYVVFLLPDGGVASKKVITFDSGGFNESAPPSAVRFGQGVVGLGDLNGDRIPDLLVGAPECDLGGTNRGCVWVLFLDSDGEAIAHQQIGSGTGGFGGSLSDEDHFGWSVAKLGDVDGDGITDAAIGAYNELNGFGAVWILFLERDGTVSEETRIADGASGFFPFPAIAQFDFFGWSVAGLGDFDENGVPDLIVGAIGDDNLLGGSSGIGAVYLLFLVSDGTVLSHRKINSVTDPEFLAILSYNGRFGFAVEALGDLNGDGTIDIAVSEPRADDGGLLESGAVHLLYLAPDGSIKGEDKLSFTEGNFDGPIAAQDQFGSSLAAIGDVDGDGITELVVGAWGDGADAGAGWILFLGGDRTRYRTANSPVASEQKMSKLYGYFHGAPLEEGDRFGSSIAYPGDYDADGRYDVLIGSAGSPTTNRAFLVRLSEADTARDWVIDAPDIPLEYGRSVSGIGDLNGDNISDWAVGSPRSGTGLPLDDRGTVRIVFVNETGNVLSRTVIGNSEGNFTGWNYVGYSFGSAVAGLGDLDGDAVPDLAVGVRKDAYAYAEAGRVWIFFLRANGTIKSQVNIDADDVSLGTGYQFGTSIAAIGDVNGDSIGDLAVGAPGIDDGATNAGGFFVLLMDVDGTVKDQKIVSASFGEFGGVIHANDLFGLSLAGIGDHNGDGIPDLAVGAPGDDDGGSGTGAFWLIYLRRDGRVYAQEKIGRISGGFLGDIESGDEFGHALARSPNGTLAVGASGDDDGGFTTGANFGAVWFLTLADRPRTEIVLRDSKISDFKGGFSPPLANGSFFGWSVAGLGDLNDDGTPDVAVGAPVDSSEGSVWILFLNEDGTVGEETEVGGASLGGLSGGDRFGSCLASPGDFDGDSVEDLLVGAHFDDDGSSNAGAVWFVFFHPNATVKGTAKISATEGNFTGPLSVSDRFGSSASFLGDVDGDSVNDLAVGASGDDTGGTDRGAVWILRLRANASVGSESKISHGVGGIVLSDGDNFGASLAALGDLDGDSFLDLATGADVTPDGGTQRGAVWMLFLGAAGASVSGTQKISSTDGSFAGAISNYDHFGRGLSSADVDGDGLRDLVVGSPFDDDGGNNRGAVWVVYTHPNGTVRNEEKISYVSGGFVGLIGDDDRFGWSTGVVGDLNGDSSIDFIVGATHDDDGGTDRGAAYVLLTRPPSVSAKRFRDQSISPLAQNAPLAADAPLAAEKRATFGEPLPSLDRIIGFADIERWCAEEGTHLAKYGEAYERNNVSVEIGQDQKFINDILIEGSVYLMNHHYRQCLVSASVSKSIDLTLGFMSRNQTLVHPRTFSDGVAFYMFVAKVARTLNVTLQYHLLNHDGPTNPYAFLAWANFSDPLEIYLGAWFDRHARSVKGIVSGGGSNVFGHAISAFGRTFYSSATREKDRREKERKRLHPDGWNSPAWLEFVRRYSRGIGGTADLWLEATGAEDRTAATRSIARIPTLISDRWAWIKAGKPYGEEPYPRGTSEDRIKWQRLRDMEREERNPWETPEWADYRMSWAFAERRNRYPGLTYLEAEGPEFRADFVPRVGFCPEGVDQDFAGCDSRFCWSPGGEEVGTCSVTSNGFSSPTCRCEYPSPGGACCTVGGCTNEASEGNCVLAGGKFAPGTNCSGDACDYVRGACCASNGTCAIETSLLSCAGTLLAGSNCSACDDASMIRGACCSNGTCSMTTLIACSGTWNVRKNCSSTALAPECGHCGSEACKECALLFESVNDIVDWWAINLEYTKDAALNGACCYGPDSNRSCAEIRLKECDALPDARWWATQSCSFCSTPLALGAIAYPSNVPPNRYEPVEASSGVDSFVVRAFDAVASFVLDLLARIFPSLEGAEITVGELGARIGEFFMCDDEESPRCGAFWLNFFLTCDPKEQVIPSAGKWGFSLPQAFVAATVTIFLLYAILNRCCGCVAGVFSGTILLFAWFFLILLIAYAYNPSCYFRSLVPRYALRPRPLPDKVQGMVPTAGRFKRWSGRVGGWTRSAAYGIVSVPMIPVEVANDTRDFLGRFDVDCWPGACEYACPLEKWPCDWETDVPFGGECIDALDCCEVAECAENRQFPKCRKDPWRFTGSERVLAYWMRTLAPRANCFLFHGDFFLTSWIGDNDAFDFPGDDCSVDTSWADARWKHCARTRSPLLAIYLIIFFILGAILYAIATVGWAAYKWLATQTKNATHWIATRKESKRISPETETETEGASETFGRSNVGDRRVKGHNRDKGSEKKE